MNLALWTGARRGDIFSMRWENVSLEDNRWQIPEPKNRVPYIVSVDARSHEILRGAKKTRK